jgi:hypothetical protein
MPAPPVHYAWRPLEGLTDPAALASPDMRAFTKVWQKQRAQLAELGVLDEFQERLARQLSIETGVLERLYDLSRGLTVMLVERGFHASLIAHGDATMDGDRLVEILHDHREGLAMVMDLIGGTRGLTVGWIKELHALLTRHQTTADGVTQAGQRVQIPLLRGAFKQRPNNPLRADGMVHEYCPPEHVLSEMDRLVADCEALPAELPEVRAAWLHHRFTQIHPFQDGNGRVARALASFEFIRAGLLPLLVERDDRDTRYFPALEAADHGDLQPLVTFFADCMSRVLLRASAAAETLITSKRDLAAVLRVGRKKIQARSATQPAMADQNRLTALASVVRTQFQSLKESITADIPGVSATIEQPAAGEESRYFRETLLLARRNGYGISSSAPRTWIRLRLETDRHRTDIVALLNSLSGSTTGVCALDAVIVLYQALGEGDTPDAYFLDIEPLLLSGDETEPDQYDRIAAWFETMKVHATAQWIQFL